MRKKLNGLIYLIVIIITFCSCDLRNKDNNNDNRLKNISLLNFTQIIGKKDTEIIDLLGEGVKDVPDGTYVITREYLYKIQDNALTAILSYNENGTVQGVYTYLPEYDVNKWEILLTDELGIPTKEQLNEGNSENGNEIINMYWIVNDRLVLLHGSDGTLSIQIE